MVLTLEVYLYNMILYMLLDQNPARKSELILFTASLSLIHQSYWIEVELIPNPNLLVTQVMMIMIKIDKDLIIKTEGEGLLKVSLIKDILVVVFSHTIIVIILKTLYMETEINTNKMIHPMMKYRLSIIIISLSEFLK